MSVNKTAVVIITRNFRIEGEINCIPGSRLTDYMNEVHRFMVVTDARVIDHGGQELVKGEFLDVQVRNIEIILPAENLV
jgi:hypothetical protein